MLDRLQVEACAVVFDIEEKRVVLPSQPNPNSARTLSIQPIFDGIRKQFVRNQRKRHCGVGKVTRKHSSQANRGRVVKQSPKASSKKRLNGFKVNLTVGR